jgi:excisionase family DNA binding protein
MRGGAGEAGRPEAPLMYTMKEVAAILKVSESTVYGITKCGDLPYIKIDRAKRIMDGDLREYMQRKRVCRKREEG